MKHSGRVIILKDNEVLLIKRVKNDRTYYVFPGGKAEVGETPEMTAMREAYEELGVQVSWATVLKRYALVRSSNIIFLQQL